MLSNKWHHSGRSKTPTVLNLSKAGVMVSDPTRGKGVCIRVSFV